MVKFALVLCQLIIDLALCIDRQVLFFQVLLQSYQLWLPCLLFQVGLVLVGSELSTYYNMLIVCRKSQIVGILFRLRLILIEALLLRLLLTLLVVEGVAAAIAFVIVHCGNLLDLGLYASLESVQMGSVVFKGQVSHVFGSEERHYFRINLINQCRNARVLLLDLNRLFLNGSIHAFLRFFPSTLDVAIGHFNGDGRMVGVNTERILALPAFVHKRAAMTMSHLFITY